MRGLLLATLLCPSLAQAFSIGSAVSHPCHEQISLLAFEDALAEATPPNAPLNEGEEWVAIHRTLGRTLEIDRYSPRLRDFAVVLVTGVRAPDVEGAASLDLGTMRERHLDPHGQHPHALRRQEDDGPDGDRAAVEAARNWMRQRVALAYESLHKPVEEQYVDTQVWLDFRGLVTVRAWAPAFHLGEALHTAQDSFAHALRSPDQRRIRQVLNYIEATGGDYDATRDGLPHSMALDACAFETAPEVLAAREASFQLLRVWRQDPAAVDAWLDRWFSLDDRCNDDCGAVPSSVEAEAQRAAAKGCASAGGILLLLVLLQRRRGPIALLAVTGCVVQPAQPALPDVAPICEMSSEVGCERSVAGRWYAAGSCNESITSLDWNGCPGAWVTQRLVAVGALVLDEDGSVDHALDLRKRRQMGFDKACLAADERCEDVRSPLGDRPCADVGDTCACPVDDEPMRPPGGHGRWAHEADVLQVEFDDGGAFTWDVCARGGVLHATLDGEALLFIGR